MSQFRPTYDRVFSKNKLPDYEYKPPPQQIGVIEGALLKRKSKKWPLKDARWKRYWVVADGSTLRYFRNERSDDDELRKLKPSNGAIARKRVPLQLCSVARTSGGRPGFEVAVTKWTSGSVRWRAVVASAPSARIDRSFACDGEADRDKRVGHLEATTLLMRGRYLKSNYVLSTPARRPHPIPVGRGCSTMIGAQ